MQLENLHPSQNYATIFGLTWSGIDDLWPCLLTVGGYQKVTSLSYHQSCMHWLHWRYHHTAHLVSSSTALAFLTNMSEKHKSTSPRAIQVKKLAKDSQYRRLMSWLEKGERIGDKCRIWRLAHSSIVMLTELKKTLSQELKCLCSKTNTYLSEWTVPKLWMLSLIFSLNLKHIHNYFFGRKSPPVGQGLLIFEVSRSLTSTTVGRTPLDEGSAHCRDLYLTTNRHPSPWRDSNPQSQQASSRRPTTYTAWPLGPATYTYTL